MFEIAIWLFRFHSKEAHRRKSNFLGSQLATATTEDFW
jgi:hypothetical protein